VPVPQEQIFAMPAELGAAEGARQYAQMLQGVAGFQLVLLGLGEDGHTASLFPGHTHPTDSRAVAVFNAPKPPPERISMSAAMLGTSDHVWFLVTGEGKRAMLNKWLQGNQIPASQVQPLAGVDIFTDINLG
jgi:6-phosphogluconolactonase